MKKQKKQNVNLPMVGFGVMALVIVIQFVLMGWFYHDTRQYMIMDTTIENNIAGVAMTGMNAAAMSRATVSPASNAVYLPELHLKLPMNDLTSQLVYSTRHTVSRGFSKEVTDISTLKDTSTNWASDMQESCMPLRVAFEASPDPFNNHEKAQAPVKLGDGRILQVYAYQDDRCGMRWRSTQLDPLALAALFESAQSY